MTRPTAAGIAHALESAVTPLGSALRGRRMSADGSLARHRTLDVPATITLTSSAFADGAVIPDRYCGPGIGEGVSPALAWSGVPEGTARLLLVLEDLDFPSARRTGIHAAAVMAATGPRGELAEGGLSPRNPGLAWVRTRPGRRGYVAPRPLPGHGPHTYLFHLFAIDTPITPPRDARLDALVGMIAGRVTARGVLTGVREA